MEPFVKLTGLVAPLDRVNVDTDQIIPKQFLKALTRQGFGRILFYDWRYLPGEVPNPEFVLNFPRYEGASILLARANFGCGSSREHARTHERYSAHIDQQHPRLNARQDTIPAAVNQFSIRRIRQRREKTRGVPTATGSSAGRRPDRACTGLRQVYPNGELLPVGATAGQRTGAVDLQLGTFGTWSCRRYVP